MSTLLDTFLNLPDKRKKAVHFALCSQALRVWKNYCDTHKELDYVEAVCGTKQVIDQDLPIAAVRAAIAGRDAENVAYRYQEPITAMHDDDLIFPDNVAFAYYSIYNLFERYVTCRNIDDWLIANQALSSNGKGADYASILAEAISKTAEQSFQQDY
jgi:hypothetical protein